MSLVAEMSDLPPDPFAPHSDRLVGHHLRFEPQSIFRFRLDSDLKIRSVSQLGSQLTDHHRGMVLREGVRLYDDRRAGLAIVTRRGNSHHVTALHQRQTRRRTRSTAKRRARDQGRDRRPASPPVVALPASGRRPLRDAVRAGPARASVAASSSSSRLAPPRASPFVTRYYVTRYKPAGKGQVSRFPSPRRAFGQSRRCSKFRLFRRTMACVLRVLSHFIIVPRRSNNQRMAVKRPIFIGRGASIPIRSRR